MQGKYLSFTGKVDRRSPRNKGELNDPVSRENLLSRDGKLSTVQGTIKAIISDLDAKATWGARYYSLEEGLTAPKTFVYTVDGKLYFCDIINRNAVEAKSGLNTNAYPNHAFFKLLTQTLMFFVDGVNLYKYDGNNDFEFEKVILTDSNDDPVYPIDVIEHNDRIWVITKTRLFVSKNLAPDVFDDATDSIELIVGSGKGTNISLGKIEDNLYIITTEGIFSVYGDVISAVASTFSIVKVDDEPAAPGRSVKKVEKALLFIGADLELHSFDGNSVKLLSYKEKLSDFIDDNRIQLEKMTSVYDNINKYYMVSIIEKGNTENTLEFWYDTLEDKIEFIKGRNVSCYIPYEATQERYNMLLGSSDSNVIRWANKNYSFDGVAIKTKLRSRDIIVKKGYNVRFTAFYVDIEPTGTRDIWFTYLLDGRLSGDSKLNKWLQDLEGEYNELGSIHIKDQSQFYDRILPRIKYSRGESIAFGIEDSTLNLQLSLLGISFDYVIKSTKKGKGIGA